MSFSFLYTAEVNSTILLSAKQQSSCTDAPTTALAIVSFKTPEKEESCVQVKDCKSKQITY